MNSGPILIGKNCSRARENREREIACNYCQRKKGGRKEKKKKRAFGAPSTIRHCKQGKKRRKATTGHQAPAKIRIQGNKSGCAPSIRTRMKSATQRGGVPRSKKGRPKGMRGGELIKKKKKKKQGRNQKKTWTSKDWVPTVETISDCKIFLQGRDRASHGEFGRRNHRKKERKQPNLTGDVNGDASGGGKSR